MVTLTISPDSFDDDTVDVTGDAYRHLFRARRLAVGDRVRLVDGTGHARWSTVEMVDRKRARLRTTELAPTNEPEIALDLIVAAIRPERAAWLVEKATEIGVHAIRFLGCERTPRSPGKGRLDRWRRVAEAAVEQCHRARVPEVSGVHDWSELPQLIADAGIVWYLSTEASTDGGDLGPASGAVLIGPEGGWSPDELRTFGELGLTPASLGPRILRVETAALAAAAKILLSPGPYGRSQAGLGAHGAVDAA